MNLIDILNPVKKIVKLHSPLLLSGAAILGTVTTAYLSGKASFRAAEVIRAHEEQEPQLIDRKKRLKERTKLVWKLYIPTAVSTASTFVFIVGANRMGARKLLAANGALGFTEQAFSSYREKIIEEFGERKDVAIRDKVATDRINSNPPPSPEVMFTGPGVVLCCEIFTGRYFTSDMESLKQAMNELNSEMLQQDYASLDDFYWRVGLKPTTQSGQIGWRPDKLMELNFTAVMTQDGRPCLAFDYNYVKSL